MRLSPGAGCLLLETVVPGRAAIGETLPSQAMGRVGELITRTWQTAHRMKVQRGRLEGEQGGE